MLKAQFNLEKCDFCNSKPERFLYKDGFFTTRMKHLCGHHYDELQMARELKNKYKRWL